MAIGGRPFADLVFELSSRATRGIWVSADAGTAAAAATGKNPDPSRSLGMTEVGKLGNIIKTQGYAVLGTNRNVCG
jgi:hypothetical protein